jgi:16S rRNA (guanine527-N7)-methyltransferase
MTSSEFRDRLGSRAQAARLTVNPAIADRLEAYYRLLATWNQRINLTGLDLESLPDGAVDRLFIEPLAAARLTEAGKAVLDVGSGGGSPAIPFAIAASARRLTMVESKSRKSVFLREAARAAALPDTQVITARFESVAGSPGIFECFQAVTVRAIRIQDADWPTMALPLSNGGSLLFLHRSEVSHPNIPTLSLDSTHQLTAAAVLTIFKRV